MSVLTPRPGLWIPELNTNNLRLKTALRDASADRGCDDAKFSHKLGESVGLKRLRAVGERGVGIVVNFNEQAVSSGGNRSAGHGRHFVAAPGAVRRIGKHGQVRKFLDDRDGRDVESVASVGFERANAALAENDV